MASRAAQTILVIDDDMSVQMFVTQSLKNAGYQVLAAADMQEAIDVSDRSLAGIDLIVTDIILPSNNGMALAEALLAKRPTTPVLYMSGAGPEAIHAIQFKGAPGGGFLEKPFSSENVVQKVRAILELGASRWNRRRPPLCGKAPMQCIDWKVRCDARSAEK